MKEQGNQSANQILMVEEKESTTKTALLSNEIEAYFDRLWPINRSLTGNGNRQSLKILSEIIPLAIEEIPCGTQCFDWTIPEEWNAKEAWIKDPQGKIVVDFKNHNLHLLGYSEGFKGELSLDQLKPHLYTIPDQPDLIPYVTSYYKKRWGFCMSHNQYEQLQEGMYQVYIDASHDPDGHMTTAHLCLPGQQKEEILFSTYFCHPSMANNELSGPLVTAFIYKELAKRKNLRFSYRFLFAPETIGTIHNLSRFGNELKENLVAGFVLTTLGDDGPYTYKKSRIGNSLPDRAVQIILKDTEKEYKVEDFFPIGSDERQYCSPGFNLPVGSLMRTRYGAYKEYHTSGDNKSFVSFEAMEATVQKYMEVINLIENNYYLVNQFPYCEPQLGKRGLYPTTAFQNFKAEYIETMMWILNLADGTNDLITIIEKCGKPYQQVLEITKKLIDGGVIKQSHIAAPIQ